MRNFDLIAFDLDGTVFFPPMAQEVSERVRRAFERAHDSGATLVVASGRPEWMLGKQIPQAPWMDWGATANGSRIVRVGAAASYGIGTPALPPDVGLLLPLEKASALALVEHVERLGGSVSAHTSSGSIMNSASVERFSKPDEQLARLLREWNVPTNVNPIAQIMRETKVEVADSVARLLRTDAAPSTFKLDLELVGIEEAEELGRIASKLGGLEVARVSSRSFEVTAEGASKGEGVAWLCRHLGISPSRVVAFGDSGNDLSFCGRGFTFVAMGNAGTEVRAAADDICDSVANDGVARWLEANL